MMTCAQLTLLTRTQLIDLMLELARNDPGVIYSEIEPEAFSVRIRMLRPKGQLMWIDSRTTATHHFEMEIVSESQGAKAMGSWRRAVEDFLFEFGGVQSAFCTYQGRLDLRFKTLPDPETALLRAGALCLNCFVHKPKNVLVSDGRGGFSKLLHPVSPTQMLDYEPDEDP